MKLSTLAINNFKSVRNLIVNADGRNISGYGRNGTGKTTALADAPTWLLFGKDSLGRKDYEIKTMVNGDVLHYLDHSVEGTFVMDGGEVLTLGRTYKEKWTKKRGSLTDEFTGHETEFTINGVPQSAGDYAAFVDRICPESRFKLLTSPSYFTEQLSWQDRRKMLFDMFANTTDAKIIAATPELAELGELLGNHSIEDFRKMTDAQRAKVNDELKNLPSRIDEANRGIPAEDKTDWAKALKGFTETLNGFQSDRATLLAGGGATPLNTRLAEIGNEIRTIESELRNAPNPDREIALAKQGNKRNELRQAEREAEALRLDIAAKSRQMESLSAEINLKDVEVTAKRAQYTAANLKEYSGDSKCPACKQDLPESDIQNAVEEFNSAKAKLLAEIKDAGVAIKGQAEKLLADHRAVQESRHQLNEKLIAIDGTIGVLQTELDSITIPDETPVDPYKDSRVIALIAERSTVQSRLDQLREDSSAALTLIDSKIESVQADIAKCNQGIATQNQRATGLLRVKELTARQKELAKTFEGLEKALYLCDQFTRAKVNLLSEQINSKFKLTTFRLFKEQINGGLQECCDVLWRENGALPSNGQAVQIGIDIIATLSEHIGFFPPIFCDNAESVTTFPKTKGQQIRLFVSESDYELRIVREGDTVADTSKPSTEPVQELALAF